MQRPADEGPGAPRADDRDDHGREIETQTMKPGFWRSLFAERRIFVKSEHGVRYYRVSPRAQIAGAVALTVALVWIVGATVSVALATLEGSAQQDRMTALELRYQTRIADLTDLQSELTENLKTAEAKLAALSLEVTQQQSRLIDAAASEQELTLGLQTLRAKLRDAVSVRDDALTKSVNMARELSLAKQRLASIRSSESDVSVTLETVSSALGQAVTTRDEALSTAEQLARKVETLQADIRTGEQRRARVFSKLEDAVQVGLGAMEKVFKRAGLNVDSLVDAVRREYNGAGGPLIPLDVSYLPGGEEESSRVSSLVGDLERINLMQIAAARLPLGQPLRSSFRFTSGFGVRRDPINHGLRRHDGIDMASGSGTPVYATAEGVVVDAGWHSGYGRMIKIRHSFGYSTIYGHLRKIRVKEGDRVARGDRIGDMGNSGRSTGTHLHYEIRVGDKPVNPLKYIEAARNVL